jgi:hypothetical protein
MGGMEWVRRARAATVNGGLGTTHTSSYSSNWGLPMYDRCPPTRLAARVRGCSTASPVEVMWRTLTPALQR